MPPTRDAARDGDAGMAPCRSTAEVCPGRVSRKASSPLLLSFLYKIAAFMGSVAAKLLLVPVSHKKESKIPLKRPLGGCYREMRNRGLLKR